MALTKRSKAAAAALKPDATVNTPVDDATTLPSDPFDAGRVLLGRCADGELLQTRWDRWGRDLIEGLAPIYDLDTVLPRVVDGIIAAHEQRKPALRQRDLERSYQPDWYQLPSMVGYAMYTDRFAGDLNGVRANIDYLNDLGITYLHLMPLLKPRTGPNDGGYAVASYREVKPELGTMDDLVGLADELHGNGISLTLDLVLNHVADQHDWAVRARNGEQKYRDYFFCYADRTQPDLLEQTLPEIFPDFAPGSFTWDDEMRGWVWTTFNSWQWDLNWANPDVFCEFADVITYLANRGADCLRLDAIAFIWKRVGTDCQGQPEVHSITQALRAIAHIATPALILKAEAIVAPQLLVPYLGQGAHAGKLSEIAYHNSLMVQIWSALAARDARLMARALGRFPTVPTTSTWGTYARCHDDIGWAIDDADAEAVGFNGFWHRRFLADFYKGDHPGSFSRGDHFQVNEETGDRRTSGTAASMTGIEVALANGDEGMLQTAIDRLHCVYAMVYGFGGIPLLFMGDELALTNDYGFVDVPEHADDNRWLHRPALPWDLAATRHDSSTVHGKVFSSIRHLGHTRATLPQLHAATQTEVLVPHDPAIVLFVRRHAAGLYVGVFNTSDTWRAFPGGFLRGLGLGGNSGRAFEHLQRQHLALLDEISIPPYAAWWLTT